MKKRIIVLVIIGLVILFIPLIAGAETQTGVCGNDLTWTLDDDGILTISGTGDMSDGNSASLFPADKVKRVVINNGVTSIGRYAFKACTQLVTGAKKSL